MKLVTIEAMFPELKGGSIYKTGRGKASTWTAALSRAGKDLQKQLKNKRFHTINATITIVDVQE